MRKIGDIIRVHRSTVKDFKGVLQFSVNIPFNASWCLFQSSDVLLRGRDHGPMTDSESENEMETEMQDGTTKRDKKSDKYENDKYTPYKFSGKSYSFDMAQERIIIDGLRQFQDQYFMKNSWIFRKQSKNLANLREMGDNKEVDLLVKIIKICEKDEYDIELRIKDISNEMWFITIPKMKFGNLKEGEIIRIRSVEVNMTSKRNVISVKTSTNILRFTRKNAIVQEMKQ